VLAGDWSGDLKAEMQQNTVEVDTRGCATADEAREELVRLRLQAAIDGNRSSTPAAGHLKSIERNRLRKCVGLTLNVAQSILLLHFFRQFVIR
jgi:hypothetical protein